MSDLIAQAVEACRTSSVMAPKTLHPRILPRKAYPAGRLPMDRTWSLIAEDRPRKRFPLAERANAS